MKLNVVFSQCLECEVIRGCGVWGEGWWEGEGWGEGWGCIVGDVWKSAHVMWTVLLIISWRDTRTFLAFFHKGLDSLLHFSQNTITIVAGELRLPNYSLKKSLSQDPHDHIRDKANNPLKKDGLQAFVILPHNEVQNCSL